VWGADLQEMIEAAGQGLVDLISDPERPPAERWEEYDIHAEDPAALLVRALRELLYCLDAGWAPVDFQVLEAKDAPATAKCRVGLAPLDKAQKHLHRQVKAVTYHDLRIQRGPQGLSTVVTFDT
jgi:SHS2 domain-containing protein